MKPTLLFLTSLTLTGILAAPAGAQSLDPGFATTSVYAPGTVYSVIEQPDGKRLALGSFLRINNTATPRVVRFNADGTLDAAFNQNLGSSSSTYRARLQSNGKYMLVAFGNVTLNFGGITRPGGLLRLNADGTGDASFDPGTGPVFASSPGYLDDALYLPNGQTLAIGYFEQFNGVAAHHIVRLNANGSVDATFNQGTGADSEIESIVPVSGGKFLIGGYFTSYNGITCNGLARLNADGSFDSSFNANLQSGSDIINMTVQPDGNVLLAGNIVTTAAPAGLGLTRLLPSGAADNTFTTPGILEAYGADSYYGEAMQVQADGKILVLRTSPVNSVLRLNPNGSIDASYAPVGDPTAVPYSITLLNSGKLAVSGFFSNFSGTLDRPLLQLNPDGTVDNSFQPLIQVNGSILSMARQTDGKLVVGGSFSEINGQAIRRLARFNADGTLDAAFSTATGPVFNLTVNDLALQPNGSMVVASGAFLRRLLASGATDATFAPGSFNGTLLRVVPQPDGQVLVGGTFSNYAGTAAPGIVRLTATGARDASFAPISSGANSLATFHNMALQPDGKLLVGGAFRPATGPVNSLRVLRYSTTGSVDATFTAPTFTLASGVFSTTLRLNALTLQPDGKLLAGGIFGAVTGAARTNVARLNADGTLDGGFIPPAITGTLYALTVQPNNRILVGGVFSGVALPNNLGRLLATGTADLSFAATAMPNSTVRALLVQPDGKIVAGGSFTAVGTASSQALTRITAANVLPVAAPQAVAERTAAWPVPAHTTLHVAPDATAHAQRLELLDALGRPVRQQTLNGTGATDLSVESLPAGIYLLRVTYAEGTVARRVQVL